LTETVALKLGDLLEEFDHRLGQQPEPEILTLTERMGFVSQQERFHKRLAIADTSNYKLIGLDDIAFNPYLLWAGAVAQNTGWEKAIISPLYPTFHVSKGHNPRFVNYLLSSEFLRSRYGAISFGSVPRKRRTTVKDFLNLRIPPQPSLVEQIRIVKLLDEVDELRKLRAQADRRTADLIPALFHEMFGDPTANAQNWRRNILGDLLDQIDGGWSPTCQDRPAQTGEWGVLKLGAVTTCKYIQTENKALMEGLAPRPELEVKAGDLLFTRKNTYELVAACALVFETRPKLMLSDLIFRFRLKPDVQLNPVFLWGLLTTRSKRKQVQTLASGSAGSMPNISKGRLVALPIEVPPLALQEEFAKRVTAIRDLESWQAASRKRLYSLFQSMLHRAFRGDL
jgi:type I restriction enzyme S subunit